MSIEEGNKIIAEFMGYKFKPNDTLNDVKGVYRMKGKLSMLITDLKYHSSWGWLMPVVEKIERLPCVFEKREDYKYKCHFIIGSGFIELSFTQKHFTDTFHPPVDYKRFFHFYSESELHPCKTKVQATWQAVIEFINWYNTKAQ